jgi:16S rRNA (guanine966-N2)-methyltransferase
MRADAGVHPQNVLAVDLVQMDNAIAVPVPQNHACGRGAASAVFVDQAKTALAALRRNIAALKLEDRARIIRWNIRSNLNCLTTANQQTDLVFMDPPYEANAVSPTLTALVSCGVLTPGARVVIEHSVREAISPSIDGLRLADQRRFGKTLVSFMEAML